MDAATAWVVACAVDCAHRNIACCSYLHDLRSAAKLTGSVPSGELATATVITNDVHALTQPAHCPQSSDTPIVLGFACSLIWSVMCASLYRFALPRLTERLLHSQRSSVVLERQRAMLLEIGFMRTASPTAHAGGGLNDQQVAETSSWILLTSMIHLLAGALSFPAACFGWYEVGGNGHLAFLIATWLMLGWCLFSAVDDTSRCLLPARKGRISGMTCPCPRSFWGLTCIAYHPFWITLILPMNQVASDQASYHMLIWAMTSGGGMQYALRQVGVALDAMTTRRRILQQGVAVVNLITVLACRAALYFPSAINCIEELTDDALLYRNTFLVTALLTGCFNIAAIVDAMKVLMWGGSVAPQIRVSEAAGAGAQSAPLTDSCAGEDSMAAPLEDEPCASRPARHAGRRGQKGRPKRSGGVRAGKAARCADDITADDDDDDGEVTFGFDAVDAEAAINDANMGDDGAFDTRQFDKPRAGTSASGCPLPEELLRRAAQRSEDYTHAEAAPQTGKRPAHTATPAVADGSRQPPPKQRPSPQQQQQRQHHGDARPTQGTAATGAARPTAKAPTADHATLYANGKMAKTNHYRLLGLTMEAGPDELKRAFHQLSKKWHPDKNPDDKARADAIFKAIKEAYECLNDPAKRRRYDHLVRAGCV